MANDKRARSVGSPTGPAADDPLDRPFGAPIAQIPGLDIDIQAESEARALGMPIQRSQRPRVSFEVNDPGQRARSRVWGRISGWLGAGGIGAAIFYPLALIRGEILMTLVWGSLAMAIISMPFIDWVERREKDDAWRRRAAYALGIAPIAVVASWWGAMTELPVFAIAFPVVFVLYIAQLILALKQEVRPATRERLMRAAVIFWAAAAAAATAKLIYLARGGAPDGVPTIVALAIAFVCAGQAVRLAKAPRSASPDKSPAGG